MLADRVLAALNHVPAPVARALRADGLLARIARPFLNPLLPARATPVVVRSGPARGLRLLIEPKREKFYWTGAYETPVQRTLAAVLRPGMTYWDVGAHIGFFALLAGRLVGPAGQVHAFEPLPANRKRLAAGLRLNDAENVVVHDIAVSRVRGEALLHTHASSSMGSLIPGGTGGRGVPTSCRTLDDLAEDLGVPDVIKIDVEHAEVDVLLGGSGLLEHHHPALLVEFSNSDLLEEARAICPSYQFERLGERHWLLR